MSFVDLVHEEPSPGKVSRFNAKELAKINPNVIPNHIAIIPDGNRRWAKKKLFEVKDGHQAGADVLMDTIKAAQELNVKIITFYAFSTENWVRPKAEISSLMALFTSYLINQRDEMVKNGIKLETIGDLSRLPSFLIQVIHDIKEATKDCDSIQLVLAFNYGSRDELCRTFKKMVQDFSEKKLAMEDINERTISKYLDTSDFGDPNLLIRTSGELRVSNFLLWQISYAEIHVSPVLWPEFTSQHLLNAILDYQNRNRRWGGD